MPGRRVRNSSNPPTKLPVARANTRARRRHVRPRGADRHAASRPIQRHDAAALSSSEARLRPTNSNSLISLDLKFPFCGIDHSPKRSGGVEFPNCAKRARRPQTHGAAAPVRRTVRTRKPRRVPRPGLLRTCFSTICCTLFDLAPNLPSLIRRVCSGCDPLLTGWQTRSV
jgi:hypothetical protein